MQTKNDNIKVPESDTPPVMPVKNQEVSEQDEDRRSKLFGPVFTKALNDVIATPLSDSNFIPSFSRGLQELYPQTKEETWQQLLLNFQKGVSMHDITPIARQRDVGAQVTIYCVFAKIFENKKELQHEELCLRKAHSLIPESMLDNKYMMLRIANCLYHQNKFEDAEKTYQSTLANLGYYQEKPPIFVGKIYFNLGLIYERTNPQEALKCFNRAVLIFGKTNPLSIRALNNIIALEKKSDDFAKYDQLFTCYINSSIKDAKDANAFCDFVEAYCTYLSDASVHIFLNTVNGDCSPLNNKIIEVVQRAKSKTGLQEFHIIRIDALHADACLSLENLDEAKALIDSVLERVDRFEELSSIPEERAFIKSKKDAWEFIQENVEECLSTNKLRF